MSEAPAPQYQAPRSNIALIVSLCVNLILAGIIAMAVFRFTLHPWGGRMGPPPPGPGVRHMLSPRFMINAAPEHADQIRAVADAHRTRVDALRSDMMAARWEVMRQFSQDKFDKAAFDKALLRMQAADAAFETEILKVASEAAAVLTPEERKKLAELRARGLGHGFGPGFGPGWHHANGGGGLMGGPRPHDPMPDGN